MKSIIGNCNNLDSLTNFPSNTTPALSQGIKFKNYQSKISKESNQNQNVFIEGFQGIEGLTSEIVSTDSVSTSASYSNPNNNPLTTQSTAIINENTQTINQQQQVEQLRKDYDAILKKYQDLMARIDSKTQEYLRRVNNNPYAGKNIRFTSGHICYVTQQGVVKLITDDIRNSLKDTNGCPGETITDVNVRYPDSDVPGTKIPELNLILGTHMKEGESCGNAGKNVYVNTLINNPIEKYVDCYNDKPPVEDVLIVDIMNKPVTSGFTALESSVYQNNTAIWGAWAAFNRNDSYYWHSAVGPNTKYNGVTGEYLGKNSLIYFSNDKLPVEVKGEWIGIVCPTSQVLTKYEIKGRQGCCGNPNARSPNSWVILGSNEDESKKNLELVDKRDNQALSYEMKTYYITNPKKYKQYYFLTTNCGNPGDKTNNRYCVQISQWNLYTNTDYSGVDESKLAMSWNPELVGYTDFKSCKLYAAQNGYQYFGMQDAGKTDGTAKCMVSNDLANSTQYGKAYKYKAVSLWDTKTSGNTGNTALLNGQGSLVVNNSSNAAIFASDSKKATDYVGCYGDSGGDRAMTLINGGKQTYNYQTCKDEATNGKYTFFGLQNSSNGKNAQCSVSNDPVKTKKYGIRSNCMPTSISSYGVRSTRGSKSFFNSNITGYATKFSGGSWSNAVYSTKPDISYYLILQDDGNMCVYRGTGPSDNQGAIWCTNTNGKQKKENPNYAAAKSKFGKNWIPSGTSLAAGDFVGSTNGSIYLIMQTDGNLVLYTTSEITDGCTANSSGNMIGGSWINSLYKFLSSGFEQNIGKLAFVDEDDMLHEYPSDNFQLTNNYTKFSKLNAINADISGASYGNATKEQCETTCNQNQSCYGYSYDFKNKVCYPKNSGMWPYGGTSQKDPNIDTYVRGKMPKTLPKGVTSDTSNVDSVQYQYYNKGESPNSTYGLSLVTKPEQDELKNLESQMKTQSTKINELINKYGTGTDNSEDQSVKNLKGMNDSLIEMQKIIDTYEDLKSENANTIESFTNYGYSANNNMNKILQDSDIIVLQKNYEYLLWTILATGSVIVAMNINRN